MSILNINILLAFIVNSYLNELFYYNISINALFFKFVIKKLVLYFYQQKLQKAPKGTPKKAP